MKKASDFRPGDRVVYRPSADRLDRGEEGTVTSVNDVYVFVCYGLPGSTSKATPAANLEHLARGVGR